jgi:hypothetical protein
MTPLPPIGARLAPLLCLTLLLAACGDSNDAGDPGRTAGGGPPVIVVGIDGAEWDVIEPMMAAGELPNFRRFVDEGAYGHLINPGPQVSPVVWTTFATGHFGRDHGVLDFVYPFTDVRQKQPVDSTLRRQPAIWNLASRHGLSSTVIGYFVSYPAEPIDGRMYTDRAWRMVDGSHHPPSLEEKSREIKAAVLDEIEPVRKRFLPWEYAPAQAEDPNNPYYRAARMVAGRLDRQIPVEEYLRRVTLAELDRPGDLFITYFRLVDYMGHSLWFWHDASDYDEQPADRERELLGGAVRESYRYMDEILGDILDRHAGEANILVISDHGFGSATGRYAVRPERADLLTGNHRADGVYLAHGPAFAPGRHEGITIMEIMPTLAVLLGVPVSDELPGSIFYDLLAEDFLAESPPTFVAAYARDWQRAEGIEVDAAAEQDAMESLRGLGYVGDGVEFGDATDGGAGFYDSEAGLVAVHVTGEITYHLLRGDVAAADAVMAELVRHRPELRKQVLARIRVKIDFFRDDVPAMADAAPATEEFIQRHAEQAG